MENCVLTKYSHSIISKKVNCLFFLNKKGLNIVNKLAIIEKIKQYIFFGYFKYLCLISFNSIIIYFYDP